MCSPGRPRSKVLLLAGDRRPWVFASTLEILDSGATVDAGISTIGVAGPTPLIKLLQYAVRCGVGSSLRTAAHTLSAVGNVSQLVTATRLTGSKGCRESGRPTSCAWLYRPRWRQPDNSRSWYESARDPGRRTARR